jgi:chitin deacetylase
MRRRIKIFGSVLFLLLILYAGWKVSKSRSFQFFGGLVSRVETTERVVALTLDDGPTQAGVEAVLPVLDSLGVKATFFVTGRELEANPEAGRRIVEAGHALGNHSWSHRHMALHSMSFIRREVERTDSLIRAVGYDEVIPFRPPFGRRFLLLPFYLKQTGRKTWLWDVEPDSYADTAASADRIAEHVAEHVRPGSIVLLHVMYASRAESRRALPLIVRRLREQGYTFVTIPGLIALR